MRILGIDPGFDRLGIAIVDKNDTGHETLVFSECFETNKKDIFADRLVQIGKRIESCIKEHKPEVLGIEKLYMTMNQKTVMNVAEARGVVVYEAKKAKLEIHEFTPMEIKIAVTGFGKASKIDVSKMVWRLIDTKNKKMGDDELDAVAIALTLSATIKHRSI